VGDRLCRANGAAGAPAVFNGLCLALAPSPRRAWLPPAGTSLCGNRMISVAWVTGGRSALPSEWRRRRPGGVAGGSVTACRPGALRSPFAGQSPAPTGRVQPPPRRCLPSPRRAWLPPAGTSLCGNRMISVAWVTGGRSALPSEWRRRRPGGVAGVTACRPGALRSPFAGQSPAPTGRVQPPPRRCLPSPRRAWLPPAGTSLCGNRMISVAWVTGGRSALPSEWRRRRPGGVAGVTTGGRSALPSEWRRRRPGGVAGVTACRPGALRSPFAGQSPAPTGRVQPPPRSPFAGQSPAPTGRVQPQLSVTPICEEPFFSPCQTPKPGTGPGFGSVGAVGPVSAGRRLSGRGPGRAPPSSR
jgi:hypothetical protein